jgi:hypothetical protein
MVSSWLNLMVEGSIRDGNIEMPVVLEASYFFRRFSSCLASLA